ncbi:hypothetical protein ACJQWK_03617 [Exserohilum turcicum]
MVITSTLLSLALMFGNVFGTPVHSDYSSGAKCATNSGSNCVCPLGTDYSESATWAVVGAPVSDVEALMNDCPNNRPGMSKRTSTYKTLLGIFNFTEILTKWEKKPNGSFIQKLEYLEAVGNLTSNPWALISAQEESLTIGQSYMRLRSGM